MGMMEAVQVINGSLTFRGIEIVCKPMLVYTKGVIEWRAHGPQTVANGGAPFVLQMRWFLRKDSVAEGPAWVSSLRDLLGVDAVADLEPNWLNWYPHVTIADCKTEYKPLLDAAVKSLCLNPVMVVVVAGSGMNGNRSRHALFFPLDASLSTMLRRLGDPQGETAEDLAIPPVLYRRLVFSPHMNTRVLSGVVGDLHMALPYKAGVDPQVEQFIGGTVTDESDMHSDVKSEAVSEEDDAKPCA
jgi:hypothetical protein